MEGMEFGRTWRAEQAVPGIGTEAHNAGQSALGGAKTNSTQKCREIGAEGKDRGAIFLTGIDRDDKKNGEFCEWRGNGLRKS